MEEILAIFLNGYRLPRETVVSCNRVRVTLWKVVCERSEVGCLQDVWRYDWRKWGDVRHTLLWPTRQLSNHPWRRQRYTSLTSVANSRRENTAYIQIKSSFVLRARLFVKWRYWDIWCWWATECRSLPKLHENRRKWWQIKYLRHLFNKTKDLLGGYSNLYNAERSLLVKWWRCSNRVAGSASLQGDCALGELLAAPPTLPKAVQPARALSPLYSSPHNTFCCSVVGAYVSYNVGSAAQVSMRPVVFLLVHIQGENYHKVSNQHGNDLTLEQFLRNAATILLSCSNLLKHFT